MTDTQTAPEVKVEVASPVQLPTVPTDRHAEVAERKARRVRREGSISNLVSAIADVTAEVGIVAKAGFNQFHRYKFAQMQDVLQKLTPVMAKHGVIIVQNEIEKKWLDNGSAVAVEYEFTIAHRSGEVWPENPRQTGLCRCRDSKGGFDDKSFNKAHTAARKYFLLSLFQIATGEEDDADEDRGGSRTPPRPAPNVIRQPEPDYDRDTGEVLTDTPPTSPAPAAVANAPSASAAAGPTRTRTANVKDEARAEARKGRDKLVEFYNGLESNDRDTVRAMRAELEKLYP